MKSLWFFVAVSLITGCAAHSRTEIKHGKKGLHISCSGLSSSWEQCDSSARTACPNGYKVLAKSGQDNEDTSGDFLFGINPAGYTSRSMIVMCR
ncbi:hypothetical protein [Pseudomonas typographi]|uniref:Lipoprotein n=1 Tax=Pseudomonas typographi TaxID=2715964 RepID=A0ABR7Z708_9PSED|nr:hypothetical protein [Pseudomonas typographi]MBD1554039.1 hypothetical protein [Pseudomonas typographi]MBD1589216.1 hypothetical protein [Pseudomonas typographi]MBD1601245.1 hypothetical protein [Pseudomonas typographi]